MSKPFDELLSRLDQVLALLEEQAHYLSLLLTEEEEPEPLAAPLDPLPAPDPEQLNRDLALMLVDYLNQLPDPTASGQPPLIVPWRIPPVRMM